MDLYFTDVSPYARRPRIAVIEAGLSNRVALRDVSPLAEHRDKVLVLGPGGKIPALVTDTGAVLGETLLITGYLDAESGGLLYPTRPRAQYRAREVEGVASVLTDALVARRYEAMRPVETSSPVVLEREASRCHRCYDALEARVQDLSSGDGGRLDLGTIAVVSALGYANWRFAEDRWSDGRPRLAAAYNRLLPPGEHRVDRAQHGARHRGQSTRASRPR